MAAMPRQPPTRVTVSRKLRPVGAEGSAQIDPFKQHR
jgi:hypothetical protein